MKNQIKYFFVSLLFLSIYSESIGNVDSLVYKIKIWGACKYFSNVKQNFNSNLIKIVDNDLTIEDFISLNNNKPARLKYISKADTNYCTVSNEWINQCNIIDDNSKNILLKLTKTRCNNKFIDISVKNYDLINYANAILGVSILWNQINYYYPHRCKLTNWDNVLTESLNILNDNKDFIDERVYLIALNNISNSMYDGHNSITYLNNESIENTITIPCNFEKELTDTLKIKEVFKSDCPLKVGDIILRVNQEIIPTRVLDKIIIDSNNRNPIPLVLKSKDTIVIEIIRDSQAVEIDLHPKDWYKIEDWYNYNTYKRSTIDFKEHNCYYLNVSDVFNKKDYKQLKSNFNSYNNYVVDLRGYPAKGGIYSKYLRRMIEMFYSENDSIWFKLVFSVTKEPGKFRIKDMPTIGGVENNKNIYVLINEFTASAPEVSGLGFLNNPLVTFIGYNTSSSFGEIAKFALLPGNIQFTTTKYGTITSNGLSLHPYGLKANIKVDYDSEIDEILLKLIK